MQKLDVAESERERQDEAAADHATGEFIDGKEKSSDASTAHVNADDLHGGNTGAG